MENIVLYSIEYYKKSVFKGSYRGMNFRIAKGGEEESPVLVATAWKGPYVLEKTEGDPLVREFEYSNDGLANADVWLTEQQKILCPESGL